MAMSETDQAWLTRIGQDPEFQRIYQRVQAATVRPGESPQDAQARVAALGPMSVDPRYELNQYLNKIGMPKGRALDIRNGEIVGLKDRTSGWSIPLAAIAAAATLGVGAFAPAVLGLGGGGGGVSAASGGGASVAGGAGAGAVGTGTGVSTAGVLGTIGNYAKDFIKDPRNLESVASGLGDASGQAAENRFLEGQQNLSRDQIRLAGRQDDRDAQSDAYRKAIQGALTANIEDSRFEGKFHGDVPRISFSGGVRPSALGEIGRTAAGTLRDQAMNALRNPQPFQVSEMERPGFWERFAGAGSVLSSLGSRFMGRRPSGPRLGDARVPQDYNT